MPRTFEANRNYNRTKSSRKQNMARIRQRHKITGEETFRNTNKTHSPNVIEEKNSTAQKPPSSNNETTTDIRSAVNDKKANEAQSPKVTKKNNSTSQKQLSSNNPPTEKTNSEVEVIDVENNNGPTETNAIRSVCSILSFV